MSKEDVEKAVQDAERFAEEDKKRREEVDIKNSADQLVFQTEKTLGELGDKVTADEKAAVEGKLNELKEAIKSGNVDEIKAKQDEVQKAFYPIAEKMYKEAGAQQAQQGQQPQQDQYNAGQQSANDDGVVDADFKEV